jgi:uncharacterized protein (UPF0297 family)
MNFWEEIYSVFRQVIFSMSEPLREVGYRLRFKRDVIFEHLIKLYYFRDSRWARVWKRSVHSAVFRVPLWTGHKYPAWDFMYDCLWKAIEDVWEVQFDSWLNFVSESLKDGFLDTGVMLRNPRPIEVGHLVDNYCFWLSHALEAKGQVSPMEVYSIIDELLDRYVFVPGNGQ